MAYIMATQFPGAKVSRIAICVSRIMEHRRILYLERSKGEKTVQSNTKRLRSLVLADIVTVICTEILN